MASATIAATAKPPTTTRLIILIKPDVPRSLAVGIDGQTVRGATRPGLQNVFRPKLLMSFALSEGWSRKSAATATYVSRNRTDNRGSRQTGRRHGALVDGFRPRRSAESTGFLPRALDGNAIAQTPEMPRSRRGPATSAGPRRRGGTHATMIGGCEAACR